MRLATFLVLTALAGNACYLCLSEYRFTELQGPLAAPGAADTTGEARVSLNQWRGEGAQELVGWFVRAGIDPDSVIAVQLHDGQAADQSQPLISLPIYGQTPDVIAQSFGGLQWSGTVSYEELWTLANAGRLVLVVHTTQSGEDQPAFSARLNVTSQQDWADACTD